MNIALNNPYRVYGLLVGADAKTINRHITRTPAYIEAEAEIPEEFTKNSFDTLGRIHRNVETLSQATSKLNLDKDKLTAALFWFYSGNSITDEPAFEALIDSKINDCLNIWSKLTASGEVTLRNSSAFHNLSTLKLILSSDGFDLHTSIFEEALTLKIKFLESDYFTELIQRATDETYKIDKKNIQLLFLNSLKTELENYKEGSIEIFVRILSKLHFIAKDDFLKDAAQQPIERLEKLINVTKEKRKVNPYDAENYGDELSEESENDLQLLSKLIGKNNIKYQSISDKIANEILQCGIDYFKEYRDGAFDPSSEAMALFLKAESLAYGSIILQRVQENKENLQDWIDEKPKREKQNKIKEDLEQLIQIFEQFDNESETIENGKKLFNRTKPFLANIKTALGSSDEFYLKLTTRVISQGQSYIIDEINRVQTVVVKQLETTFSQIDKINLFDAYKIKLRSAWELTMLLGTIEMEYDFKINRFNKNKESLRRLCNQVNVNTSSPNSKPSSSSTQKPSYNSGPYSSSSTTSTKNEEIPIWLKWVVGIILFIIIVKACGN